MKKTLYYKAIVREYGLMKNDGFIIAEIKDGKLNRLEGVFTEDYLMAEFIGDRIFLSYFSRREAFGEYERNWTVELIYVELPLNLQVYTDIEFERKTVLGITEIQTVDTKLSKDEKKKCDNWLSKIKNNVFGEERN